MPVRLLLLSVALSIASFLGGCAVHPLTNSQGITAPCKGSGPIGPTLIDYCVARFEEHGFVSDEQVGSTGLILGISGSDDAIVTGVRAGSAADQAGIAVGDEIVAVNGQTIVPTPASVARRLLFGRTGTPVQVTYRRNGASKDIDLVRASKPADVPDPTASSLVSSYPMIDADDRVIPCFAAGIAAAVKSSICEDYFGSYGYVYTADVGSVGIGLDESRRDAAVIARMEPGLPAAMAGLQAGDEIVQLDHEPLTASRGRMAMERMFGRVGDSVQVTVRRRGAADRSVTLVLGKK